MERRLWTAEEDRAIRRLVQEHGNKKWTIIAERMAEEVGIIRSGKQCRERWYNHLDPLIKKQKWSRDEEEALFQIHRQIGNRWKIISKLLPGRTDNAIKNHFYSTLRRSLRRLNKFLGSKNSTSQMRSIKPCVLSKILDYTYTGTGRSLDLNPNQEVVSLAPTSFSSFLGANSTSSVGMQETSQERGVPDIQDLPSLIFHFSAFKPLKERDRATSEVMSQSQKEQLETIVHTIILFR